MNTVNIKFVAKEGVLVPAYKTSGAAGADVCAYLDKPVTIKKGIQALEKH